MVGGVLLGLVFSRIIIPSSDVVLLAGLFSVIHVVFWTPGLYLLLRRQPFRKGLSFYSVWAGLATLMTLFSFAGRGDLSASYSFLRIDNIYGC